VPQPQFCTQRVHVVDILIPKEEIYMSAIPRLNTIIGALEQGKTVMGSFASADIPSAVELSTSKYDGVIFEMEHQPWDAVVLRDTLQYMLNRRQIVARGTVAPGVTPIVRIPANGGENNQWLAKQALDMGAYGIVWPHVSTVDQAYNAVSACRYPRLKKAPRYEPAGIRGDAPIAASRYWGLTQADYYTKADVWPLDPNGEILSILMIEDTLAIENLDEILKNVAGIGAVLIGEGDLSQELGHPRDYEHPEVASARAEIVKICKANKVAVGHPHVTGGNVERVISEGYNILLLKAGRNYSGVEKGLQLIGRA